MKGLDANQLVSTLIWAVVVLVALIGVMMLLRLLLSRRKRQGDRIGVVERLPVGGDAELMLVRCDDREHLVCLTGGGGFLVDANISGGVPARGAAPGAAPVKSQEHVATIPAQPTPPQATPPQPTPAQPAPAAPPSRSATQRPQPAVAPPAASPAQPVPPAPPATEKSAVPGPQPRPRKPGDA